MSTTESMAAESAATHGAAIDIDALRAQLKVAEADAIAAADAIPPLPTDVGAGDADTMILILLEIRLRLGDTKEAAKAAVGIQRMAERKQAQAALDVASLEYSRLNHAIKKFYRLARGYPA